MHWKINLLFAEATNFISENTPNKKIDVKKKIRIGVKLFLNMSKKDKKINRPPIRGTFLLVIKFWWWSPVLLNKNLNFKKRNFNRKIKNKVNRGV